MSITLYYVLFFIQLHLSVVLNNLKFYKYYSIYNKQMSLEQDYTTVPGQLFACLSVIGPEAPQKNDKFGIKIRGTFSTRDEAASHAKRLQREDSTF